MEDSNHRIFIEDSTNNSFYFIVRSSLSNSNIQEKDFIKYENIIICKVYDRGLFVGYHIYLKCDSFVYADNFIVTTKEMPANDKSTLVFKNEDLIIFEKCISKNILILGA